jgi:phosphoribosylformylglycinamidine (FGAM) synthase-like amidotransferase family enzyme
VLAEARLVPGVLLRNANQQYICKNIYLTPQSPDALLTAGLMGDQNAQSAYKIPMAHGEGRYFADAGYAQIAQRQWAGAVPVLRRNGSQYRCSQTQMEV